MASSPECSARADFFVHPDYRRLGQYRVEKAVDLFEAALRERIDKSPLPILIHGPEATRRGDFWDLFPDDQRFMSEADRGYLNDDGGVIPRFNELFITEGVGGGTVHGSYLEACVREFRSSIKILGETGLLHVPEPDLVACSNDLLEPRTVKYGIVLCTANNREDLPPEFDFPGKHYADDAQLFFTS